ncbi:hypothetical protein WOLCODRAFT_149760 [Wolfiporia cocos MD-104 SS10]|uniref:Uncharacterized protein n=1 Tax=Wolfiporia cocos (strain MD-104) TaxID=742152 RepID=A0A2H3JLP8_WOLCO|nr:hypothetical protein WOLCODRAFT_149760 [Wolfiporia cocos MD-104 SS10]
MSSNASSSNAPLATHHSLRLHAQEADCIQEVPRESEEPTNIEVHLPPVEEEGVIMEDPANPLGSQDPTNPRPLSQLPKAAHPCIQPDVHAAIMNTTWQRAAAISFDMGETLERAL